MRNTCLATFAAILVAACIAVAAIPAPAVPALAEPRATLTPAPQSGLSLVSLPGEVAPGGTAQISAALHRDGQAAQPVTIRVQVAGAQIVQLASRAGSTAGVCDADSCTLSVGDGSPGMLWLTLRAAPCGVAAVDAVITADGLTQRARIPITPGGRCRTYLPLVTR